MEARHGGPPPANVFSELPVGVLDGLEVAVECPVGHVVAEVQALFGGVAEVESDPDACVDDLVLDVVDVVELAGGSEGGAAVGGSWNGDVEVVGVQGGCECVGEGAGQAAVRRWVFGMGGRGYERCPSRVGGRVGIAVLVGVLDGGDRPPGEVEVLGVETADAGVGRDELAHRHQVRRIDDVHAVLADDVLHRLVVQVDAVGVPEVRGRRLVRGADGAVERAVGFGLVQVLGVLLAGQRRWRTDPELRRLLKQERPHRRNPGRLRRLSRRLQLPLAGQDRPDRAVGRRCRVAAVTSAQRNDVARRSIADRDPVRDVSRERRDVAVVLRVDVRLLVGQVVVERRPCGCGNRRLHRGAGNDREREVVVGLVATRDLRHGVVDRRLDIRHVDQPFDLELRRRRSTNRIHRVRVPRQHRARRHLGLLVRRRRGHRQRRQGGNRGDTDQDEQGRDPMRLANHLSSFSRKV